MKRPSFQFYPSDWKGNAKLRRCSPAARGAWMDVLCVLHDSDEYGIIRWPLSELASVAGVSLKLVKELAAKGVLKGGDSGCEEFTFSPSHSGKKGEAFTLVFASNESCWFSSRMVTDEFIRQRRGKNSRFSGDTEENDQPKSAPKATPKSEPKPVPKVPIGDIFGPRIGDGPTSSSPSPSASTPVSSYEETGSASVSRETKSGEKKKPDDPWREVYAYGRKLLGSSAGGIITNLRKTFDDKPRKVMAKLQDAEEKRNPSEWLNAFLWQHGPPGLEGIDTSGGVV